MTRYPREQLEEAVNIPVAKYPAAFFVDENQRRPLKADIDQDLVNDGNGELLVEGGLNYYRRNWGYQRSLQAGAERVDLNGQKAGYGILIGSRELDEDRALRGECVGIDGGKPSRVRLARGAQRPSQRAIDVVGSARLSSARAVRIAGNQAGNDCLKRIGFCRGDGFQRLESFGRRRRLCHCAAPRHC
jgi:hypothetical protein